MAARVVWLAWIVAYLVLFRALLYLGPEDASDAMLLVAWMGVVAIHFATVLAHELGHVVAGIFWGLTPVAMRVGPFEGRRRRRGWRVRWKRRAPGTPAGYAASLPTTGCDLPRAFRRHLLGGATANLAIALAACAIAPGLAQPEWRDFVFAVAAFNAVVGVSNLLPYRPASWPAGTDGYQFWRHRKGRSSTPEALLTLANLRICGRMLEGATASSLPEADIALLASGASAERLLAKSIRVQIALEQDDPQRAEEMLATADALFRSLPAHEQAALLAHMEGLRGSVAVCRAIADRDPGPLAGAIVGDDLDWHAPYLRPRLDGLRAAFAGDRARMETGLARAARLADDSFGTGTAATERALHARIRALADALAAPSAQADQLQK